MDFPRKVYAIQHNVTKRIYIGSSRKVKDRYMNHMYRLRSGKHHIEDMQDDFIKYGEDFSLFILDEITEFEDRFKEYEWMDKYKTYCRGIGYNYKDYIGIKHINKNRVQIKEGLPEPMRGESYEGEGSGSALRS